MWILLVIALMMGMLVPVQTAANARMRLSVGPAYVVTLISFAVSSLLLILVSLIAGIRIFPSSQQIVAVPWWGWTGGIIALLTITVTIYLFRALGQLQTAVLPLLGQLLFSLVIDHFGLFGSVRIPLSAVRVVAMLLLISGVFLIVVLPNIGKHTETQPRSVRHVWLWQVVGVVAGCLMASIGAIYGRLGVSLGSAVQSSTISFIIATIVMALACALNGKIVLVRKAFAAGSPWWMWLGGVCGAISVFGNAWLIPLIGAGAFFMALLLGQMSTSVVMENQGWLGSMRRRIAPVQIIGIALMVAGVAMIRL